MLNNTFYIITEGPDADRIYGDQYPTCLSRAEVERLSKEWAVDLLSVMHEASAEEIAEYGISE